MFPRNFLQSSERPEVIENTIQSFRQAAEHGADFVEFDVQLTQDLVPVIYHDFHTCVFAERAAGGPSVPHKVFLKDLSLKDLRRLKLEHVKACKGGVKGKCPGGELDRAFPTLEEVSFVLCLPGHGFE